MTQPFTTRRGAVGVAISETRLYTMLPASSGGGNTTPREWSLDPLGRADAEWPTLVAALTELRETLPNTTHTLAVALLPPLAKIRRVELPKLRAGELRLVLTRNATRYLPGVREPYTANGVALASTSPVPYSMAAAPTRLIEAVARAVQESGWTLTTIVPAYAAWVAAAQHKWPSHRQEGDIAVRMGGYVDILQVHAGHVDRVHRLRDGEQPPALAARTLDHPAETAATFATSTAGPELLPERMYMQRAAARRRVVMWGVAALAAAIVLAAAGVLARAKYVLHQAVIQRTALQSQSDQAIKARNDIAALTAPAGALGRIETNAVLWSQVLADLTEVLPTDASLNSFRAHGDSLAVAGTATHGGDVFEHMDGAKLIDNVRPTGPIRHDTKPGAPSFDRFEFAARISGAAPLYSAKAPRAHTATRQP
jgi:hypothetical protein